MKSERKNLVIIILSLFGTNIFVYLTVLLAVHGFDRLTALNIVAIIIGILASITAGVSLVLEITVNRKRLEKSKSTDYDNGEIDDS